MCVLYLGSNARGICFFIIGQEAICITEIWKMDPKKTENSCNVYASPDRIEQATEEERPPKGLKRLGAN